MNGRKSTHPKTAEKPVDRRRKEGKKNMKILLIEDDIEISEMLCS